MRDLIERAHEVLVQTEASVEEMIRGAEDRIRAMNEATAADVRGDLVQALTETRSVIRELGQQFRVALDINLAERRGEELNRALAALRLELPGEIVRDLTAVIDRRLDKA